MLAPIAGSLERYMDLLSARQNLVASHIANADTPAHKTKDAIVASDPVSSPFASVFQSNVAAISAAKSMIQNSIEPLRSGATPMSSPISPISAAGLGPAHIPTIGATSQPGAFQDALDNAISRVEQQRNTADQTVGRFLAGEGEELHTTVMATQKAELAFELFLQVRNKVVSAYQEIMRMQI